MRPASSRLSMDEIFRPVTIKSPMLTHVLRVSSNALRLTLKAQLFNPEEIVLMVQSNLLMEFTPLLCSINLHFNNETVIFELYFDDIRDAMEMHTLLVYK